MNAPISAAPVVAVGNVRFGNKLPITVIGGPCQLESRAHALEVASALNAAGIDFAESAGNIVVPPHAAHGATLIFESPK